jgi:hypothetical protein
MMDPECSDDAKSLARDIIDALDEARSDREWWLVSARTLKDGPSITVGPYSTRNQALKAASRIAFADDPATTPGLGYLVHMMKPPSWLDRF